MLISAGQGHACLLASADAKWWNASQCWEISGNMLVRNRRWEVWASPSPGTTWSRTECSDTGPFAMVSLSLLTYFPWLADTSHCSLLSSTQTDNYLPMVPAAFSLSPRSGHKSPVMVIPVCRELSLQGKISAWANYSTLELCESSM